MLKALISDTFDVFIDLNEAGLDLEPEELQSYSLRLATDLRKGLAEEAVLTRAADVPEGSKAGEAGFTLGVLKAKVNLKNIKAFLDYLGERIYRTTLRIEYGDVKLEYRTRQELEQQLEAVEKISHLTVRVVKSEAGKGVEASAERIWQHSQLKTTAAQRAGLTDISWSWGDLATYPTSLQSTPAT